MLRRSQISRPLLGLQLELVGMRHVVVDAGRAARGPGVRTAATAAVAPTAAVAHRVAVVGPAARRHVDLAQRRPGRCLAG